MQQFIIFLHFECGFLPKMQEEVQHCAIRASPAPLIHLFLPSSLANAILLPHIAL
jgi:hypothetical protein